MLSTSADGLQNSINRLTEYCRKWKLNINMSKTKTICLSSSTKYAVNFQIKCHDKPLERVDTYPYLGFELSSNNCSCYGKKHDGKSPKSFIQTKKSIIWIGVKTKIMFTNV